MKTCVAIVASVMVKKATDCVVVVVVVVMVGGCGVGGIVLLCFEGGIMPCLWCVII